MGIGVGVRALFKLHNITWSSQDFFFFKVLSCHCSAYWVLERFFSTYDSTDPYQNASVKPLTLTFKNRIFIQTATLRKTNFQGCYTSSPVTASLFTQLPPSSACSRFLSAFCLSKSPFSENWDPQVKFTTNLAIFDLLGFSLKRSPLSKITGWL